MKTNDKLWLQDKGTREGNNIVFKRAYVPSHETDIRETFRNIMLNRTIEQWELVQRLDEEFKD
jgi:hypothetical protein